MISIVAFYCLKGLKLIYVWSNLSVCSPSKDKTYLRTAICLLFCCHHGAILCEVLWVNNALFP